MKYADPSRCPDCREVLPHGATHCPHCGLVVRHPLAQQVFATLSTADALLDRLRAESAPTAAADSPLTPPRPQPDSAPPPPPYPAARPHTRRLGLASVPKILLGLGALCLLVAAVTFLAVSWTWLGVGGRTTVLVVLTVAAGAASVTLLRFGLRIAAEALAAVCLGLVALDVAGAESAGWLGDVSGSALLLALGVTVGVLGSAFAFLTRPHLVAPQVAAGLSAAAAYAGALGVTPHDLVAGHVVLVVVAAAMVATHRVDLRTESVGLAAVAVLVWGVTAVTAWEVALWEPTLRALWVTDGAGWSLLASAAAPTVVGALTRRTDLAVGSGALAALVTTVALTAPAVDESARTAAVVALLVTGAWTGAAALLPRTVRPIALTPATAGALAVVVLLVLTGLVAVVRWAELGDPFGSDLDVRLVRPEAVTEPLVAAPGMALLVALAAVARLQRASPAAWCARGALLTGVAGLATLASYDVPLAAVSGAGAVLTLAALAGTLLTRGRGAAAGVTTLLLAVAGCVVALPNATLTALAAGLGLGVATCLHLAAPDARVRPLAGVAVAPTLGLTLAAGAAALEIDRALVGVPVVVAVGLLALVRPRPEVEVPAALAAVAATLASVPAAADSGGSLALHLTVAGVLVAANALVHSARRHLRWVGSALLLVASWVRLADLGVGAPEAYTLPLACVLLALGTWRLLRDTEAGTMPTLLPGLLLATVPSLLWVLDDPVSLRALLLGGGCLAAALGGAALRWGAPLVVGATVGAVLVLREVAPYAAALPQWVWIGLAGALLTVVGVTWERRLREVRRVAGHVGRLR